MITQADHPCPPPRRWFRARMERVWHLESDYTTIEASPFQSRHYMSRAVCNRSGVAYEFRDDPPGIDEVCNGCYTVDQTEAVGTEEARRADEEMGQPTMMTVCERKLYDAHSEDGNGNPLSHNERVTQAKHLAGMERVLSAQDPADDRMYGLRP